MEQRFCCKSILKRKSFDQGLPPSPAIVDNVLDAERRNKTTNGNGNCDHQPPAVAASAVKQSALKYFSLKSCRQGILKKQSASFDDETSLHQQKPILKNRCGSCDDDAVGCNELHSILKRKTAGQQRPNSGVDPWPPAAEPPQQGILKKRDLAAAAATAEHPSVVDITADEEIRPILKQKRIAVDHQTSVADTPAASEPEENTIGGDGSAVMLPKPILKKKLSDACPPTAAVAEVQPILKTSAASDTPVKRLSVAERISNLESIARYRSTESAAAAYRKPTRENARSARDRSRFHTQPVTPDELQRAVKK